MNRAPLLIFLLYINSCVCKKYYNYTLYRSIPITEYQLSFLRNLTTEYGADYWRHPGLLHKPVEFLIGPEERKSFLRTAVNMDMYLTTLIDDVQSAFDKQTVKTYIRRQMDSFDWQSFFRLKDIYVWLKDLAKAHPKVMQIRSIGKTHQDRDIIAATIIFPGRANRSKVIVEGGIHAREWIAPAFVTYFLYQILNSPKSGNKELESIAKHYEWHFVPVLNADGYEYSHTRDRLWRKNCNGRGVDLNRNFAMAFGTIGISGVKKDEDYCGEAAFSEKESAAMAKFVESVSQDLKYYLAFHSYGQYIIIPYAHTSNHLDNYSDMKNICDDAASEIRRRFGTTYSVGTAYDTVGYMTSGVSGCWAKKSYSIPYVATFELRDEGQHGFALPPNQILPTCLETMDGMMSILTPRDESVRPFIGPLLPNRQDNIVLLDKIVIAFNILLFIIVRFD